MLSKSVIKYIQSLQQKKFRDEHKVFIAEGTKLVNELLSDKNFTCEKIYCLPEWKQDTFSENLAIELVKDFELEKISGLVKPNLVLAIFKQKHSIASFQVAGKITLLLDDIQDPGNMGTIIRTADWFAIQNIVCSLNSADCYNSKVVQSSMASLGRVNLVYTKLEQWLKENNKINILAATLHGRPLHEYQHIREAFIIIGNESKGISPALLSMANEKISIEKWGEAESLNAGVATGILLYHLKNS